MGADNTNHQTLDAFIDKWTKAEGGAERANYAIFIVELCDQLGVPRPDVAGPDARHNDYVFERAVLDRGVDVGARKRIDLYKKDCFVLEAKQSRLKGRPKEINFPEQREVKHEAQGRRTADRQWDVLMKNARQQAEDYAWLIAREHAWPPFIIVCDVGHCFEIYADFSGQGRNYAQFPNRQGFRIYMEDLRDAKIRERLRQIWTEPHALDSTRQAAKVTRDVAARLAAVSRKLEETHKPEDVAQFLMRCLFTMFAEDVKLLPEDSFTNLLKECVEKPDIFVPELEQLWKEMDMGVSYSRTVKGPIKRFNGALFKDATAFAIPREELGELLAAAKANWREVEPAIFGTLLEQALNKAERAKLGAHFTPRAFVERLVVPTIMEPLRQDWAAAQAAAEEKRQAGDLKGAQAEIQAFHDALCKTRVLDPACGTGNFLYVAMELMKRLEGEVLEALADLGGQPKLALEHQTIDPHQFLGLEINPRAATIAELVLWIGYLQLHLRANGGEPAEPILQPFTNINFGEKTHAYDAVLSPNLAERPEWPEAEFIVGNPPFIGGKDIREKLGGGYAEALWAAHKHMNASADFVMYWWDRAADILTKPETKLRRFGFVTTNSITQEFSRRVIQARMGSKSPLSLVMAIPDHPWTKETKESASVRIAMSVAVAGNVPGLLHEVVREEGLATDQPIIELSTQGGRINPDLTLGVDVTKAVALRANEGVCSPGVKLHGDGFIVTPEEAAALGLGRRPGLERHIRHYRNGRDLTARPRGVMVIDLLGLSPEEIRRAYPEVYAHLLARVKPERESNNRATYKDNWWLFGEPRRELRPALDGLPRYIATVETAKHRVFQFLDASILPDNMLVCAALSGASILGILTSRIHLTWVGNAGGTLEDRPRYTKSNCFDPFPFPHVSGALKDRLARVAEDLDAHRKRVQSEHADITLTDMYNVLEAVRVGGDLDEKEMSIRDRAAILTLKDFHDEIDRLVAEAYGWPADLSEDQILEKLMALNAERAAEEVRGEIRWLRPDYQIPRFAPKAAAAEQVEAELETVDAKVRKLRFPLLPAARTASVMAALYGASGPVSAEALARSFDQGKKILTPVQNTLTALARMGFASSDDGGKTFYARRAA